MPTSLTVERFGPAVLALLGGIACFFFGAVVPDRFAKELLAAILSAAAVFAGFLTTALTILLSLGSTAVGRRLARRGKLPHLYAYLKRAIESCLLLSVICLVEFFFIVENGGIPPLLTSALAASVVYAGATIYRIVDILVTVMGQMTETETKDG